MTLFLENYVAVCASIASFAWLCWDLCLTLDEEIRFVWPARWSPMKYGYYFVRCIALIIQMLCLHRTLAVGPVGILKEDSWYADPRNYIIWKSAHLIMTICVHLCAEYVLLLRVLALYSRQHKLKRAVSSLFVMRGLLSFISITLYLYTLAYGRCGCLDSCTVTHGPRSIYIYGVSAVLYHMVLFALTLLKFVASLRSGWGRTPIMMLIMRDGTWSFCLIFSSVTVIGSIAWSGGSAVMPAMALFNWLNSIFSFVGYRTLLNLFKYTTAKRSNMVVEQGDMIRQYFSTNLFSQQMLSLSGANDGKTSA